MNKKVEKMLQSMIDENAVGFKDATYKALYEKVNQRFQTEYKKTAKKVFSIQEEKVKIEDLEVSDQE